VFHLQKAAPKAMDHSPVLQPLSTAPRASRCYTVLSPSGFNGE
jgi:hypothetical protein